MDIAKTIEHLQQEKQKLEQAIAALEELRRTSGCLQDPARPHSGRGRKGMGQYERQEVSRRMKNYWASRRGGVVQRGTDSTH